MTEVKAGQKYRHFKGNRYTVVAVGRNTETMEDMVVYRDDEHVWIRPLAMFCETVEKNGETFPRFSLISDEED